MDTQHCSAHSGNEAIAYCIKDGVLYCAKCFDKHDKHDHASIENFKSAQNAYGQATLIHKTSTLLSKHKIVAGRRFNASEAYLSKQKKAILGTLPEMFKQPALKNFKNGKEMGNQLIEEVEKVLSFIDKFTEANINAIMHVVW